MASPRLRWLTDASRHWRTADDGGLGTAALVDGGDLLRADDGRWGLGGGTARAGRGRGRVGRSAGGGGSGGAARAVVATRLGARAGATSGGGARGARIGAEATARTRPTTV
jgi:hypothetical protein